MSLLNSRDDVWRTMLKAPIQHPVILVRFPPGAVVMQQTHVLSNVLVISRIGAHMRHVNSGDLHAIRVAEILGPDAVLVGQSLAAGVQQGEDLILIQSLIMHGVVHRPVSSEKRVWHYE